MKIFAYIKPPSACPIGGELYRKVNLAPRPRSASVYYFYEYRSPDGREFCCTGHTLEVCRHRRDLWLESGKHSNDFLSSEYIYP
ncbi:DUF3873 family protein [Alistipes ihumii]|uniref:DUF3873 family protein n=1 Tax=Alistipes ihumii TaxID=1470347 RepID=UPI003991E045